MLDKDRIYNPRRADRVRGWLFTTTVQDGDLIKLDTRIHSLRELEDYLILPTKVELWSKMLELGYLEVVAVNEVARYGKYWTRVRAGGFEAYALGYELLHFTKFKAVRNKCN